VRPAWFYRVVAALFAAGAAFHALRLLAPLAGDGSTPARHGVFVAINALTAAGLLARPRWFVLPFALLTAQQLASHGRAALDAWRERGELDLTSVAIVVLLPLTLALLLRDARQSD
jgi:hypothetical protein